jgi:hypothetical protein
VRDTDEAVEGLLRDTFGAARPASGDDLTGLRDASWARADRLRRRRAGVVGATTAGVVGATALAVVVGTGLWGPQRALDPVPAATTKATTKPAVSNASANLVPGSGSFAYRFPDGLSGVMANGLVPVGNISSSPDLSGQAGGCRWEELKDRRQPIAGWSRLFEVEGSGGTGAANLGVAGFTTGTGEAAMEDLRRGALPCLTAPDLDARTWNGPGDAGPSDSSLLWTGTANMGGTTRTTSLAVVRVGDVLVASSALTDTAEGARRVATETATAAATLLLDKKFPPALGEPLGASRSAPNAASKPGAPKATPVAPEAAYEIADVYPSEEELGNGLKYPGDPITGANMPTASGVQMCDNTGEPDQDARDAKPDPVAGTQNMAWAGAGNLDDPAVNISVTGWVPGTGAERFGELQRNEGGCRWMPDQQRLAWAGVDPATTWLSTGTENGITSYLASRLVGDVIVSVVVNGLPRDQAIAEATRLNGIVTSKVKANVPAAKGR